MNHRASSMLRLAVVVVGGLASVATSKVESGERDNGDGTATCPSGEQCTDATPNGLYFGGARTGAIGPFRTEWVEATAIGGTQTIRLFHDPDGTMPFSLPFLAETDGTPISIVSQGASAVTIAAESTGPARLRIVEPETELLYDRITLDSYPVDRMLVAPAGQYLFHDLDLWGGDMKFVIMVGQTVRIAAQMFATGGVRLVDESMSFELSSEVTGDPLGFADTVAVTATTPGTVDVVVRQDSRVTYLPVTAVTGADRLEVVESGSPIRPRLDAPRTVCFRAMSGDAAVLGVDWVYRATSRLSLAQADDDVASGCIEITGTELGDATITVSAGGLSVDFPTTVEPSAAGQAATANKVRPVERSLAGERAENGWR